jgi:hypothetical protein
VRYICESLLERKIIRPLYQLNYFALGMNDFGVYLSRGSESTAGRKKFEALMENFSSLFWIAKASGAYQYALSFVAARAYELDDLFTAIRPTESGTHFEKSFGLRLDWTIFPPSYLDGETKRRPLVRMTAKDPHETIDDID